MTAQPEETFVVAYPCNSHCVVEIPLAGIHIRFTHRQMREKADAEHLGLHGPVPKTPIHDGLRAEFVAPARN